MKRGPRDKGQVKKTEPVGLRVEPGLKKLLDKCANAQKRTVANYVMIAIMEKLERDKQGEGT